MAPAGNQHREEGRTGWWAMKEMKLVFSSSSTTYIDVPWFLPSSPFFCAYIHFPLYYQEKELNIKASTASTSTERERDNALFIFSFSLMLRARARREDQTDAQTGNYHVAVDVLFIHVWQLRNFFFFSFPRAHSPPFF